MFDFFNPLLVCACMQQIPHEECGDDHGRRDCRRSCVAKVSFLLVLWYHRLVFLSVCLELLCLTSSTHCMQQIRQEEWGYDHGRRDCKRNCVAKVSFLLLLVVCLSLFVSFPFALVSFVCFTLLACLLHREYKNNNRGGKRKKCMCVSVDDSMTRIATVSNDDSMTPGHSRPRAQP